LEKEKTTVCSLVEENFLEVHFEKYSNFGMYMDATMVFECP
jgi:hypothetical protein